MRECEGGKPKDPMKGMKEREDKTHEKGEKGRMKKSASASDLLRGRNILPCGQLPRG
jgi:hypothetical protein